MNNNFVKILLALILVIILGFLLFDKRYFPFLSAKQENVQKSDLVCTECNLVFIAYDALQANHVSHLGYPKQTTPTLDELASKGVSFSNAISAASWTVPSYMSIFTGLYPTEHKLINKYTTFSKEQQTISHLKKLSPQVQTFAEVLKSNGYVTGGFTGDAGVHSMFGYNQGFDIYTDEKSFGSVENSAEHAIKWLQENKNNKFFIFLHGYDSHGQFQTSDNYKGKFMTNKYGGTFKGTSAEQKNLREEGLLKGKLELSQADIDFWRELYDSKIYDADSRVKNFLEQFEQMNPKNKTVFVIFADHGTEVFEHQRTDHGFSLYNELVHVPLVFVIPGMDGGKVINSQVSTIDIPSTLIELLGIKVGDKFKSQLRGVSLLPFIDGKQTIRSEVFIETDYRDYTHKRGVMTSDGWKLIITMENGMKELYNLNNDPQETNNLSASNSEKTATLEILINNHIKNMGGNIDGPWSIGCLPVYGDQCQDVLKDVELPPQRPSGKIQEYF